MTPESSNTPNAKKEAEINKLRAQITSLERQIDNRIVLARQKGTSSEAIAAINEECDKFEHKLLIYGQPLQI